MLQIKDTNPLLRKYSKPELSVYGTVGDLTRTSGDEGIVEDETNALKTSDAPL